MKQLTKRAKRAGGLIAGVSVLAMWMVMSVSVPVMRAALASPASSTNSAIASESFTYSTGELNTQNGGTGWGGAWNAQTTLTEVVSASMSFAVPGGGTVNGGGSALQVSGNNDNAAFRPLSAPQGGAEVFVSFLLRFNGTVNDGDFLSMWFDNFTVGDHGFLPQIGINSNAGSGTTDFFARVDTASAVFSATALTPGTDYFVVGRLFKSDPEGANLYDRFSLWINPSFGDSGSPQATSSATGTTALFSNIGFRSVNLDAGDSILVDELCLGTTWEDCVPPACSEITCPADITQPNDPNECGAVVNYPAPTGCDVPITCSPLSGTMFPVGTTTVTCTVSEESTNKEKVTTNSAVQISCSFTVTVNDTEPPTITCPDNVNTSTDTDQCSAVLEYQPPFVTDNCPCGSPKKQTNGPLGDTSCPATCNPPSGSTFPKGTTTVTCTATDAAGNTATCAFTITVNDTQPPAITCPKNITVNNEPDQCGASVDFPLPTITDNCPCNGDKKKAFAPAGNGTCTVTCDPAPGEFFPVGTTTVTCTATDASGNTASCTFTVTVNDVQAPTITCPSNVTAVTSQSCQPATGGVVNFTPTASDNCSGVTTMCSPPSGSTFPVGTTTVTCTATDMSGNTATCSFTVTVFNGCLQDDTNAGNVALFNTFTGEYRFCCNGVLIKAGIGIVTQQGCVVTIQHNTTDRRVLIKVDFTQKKGNASLQAPPGTLKCTITDRNITNNTCACGGAPPV